MRSPARITEVAWGCCVVCAFALVAYGTYLVPGVSGASIVATSLVLAIYGIVGWRDWLWTGLGASSRRVCWRFGIPAAAVFVIEIVLEYALVPADNSRW